MLMHTINMAKLLNRILYACYNMNPWGVLSGAPSVNKTDPVYLRAGALKGDMVELLVELNAYPDPEMTWWRSNGSENTPLPTDGYEVESTGTSSKLIISHIQEGQFGDYTLMVTNTHGSLFSEDGREGVTFQVTSLSKYSLQVICCKQFLLWCTFSIFDCRVYTL